MFSVLLSLVLGANQIFVPRDAGPAFLPSCAQAHLIRKNEVVFAATISLPGVQVETLNPYGHSTTQIYPTWKHVIEPLVEWSWSKKKLVPILAEAWSSPEIGR